MNEAQIENTAVEEEAFFSQEDMKDLTGTTGDTVEPLQEEVSTPTEPTEKEVDYTPLLESLSKNIKYMDKEVKIESIDDLVKNYQKGLNYERLEEKVKGLENSPELNYIRTKAKELGMTPEKYIEEVQNYEKQQAEAVYKQQYDELVESGVSETLAKEIVENNKLAKEYKQDKLRREEEMKLQQEKARKDADNDMFLKAYPDVDLKSIPSEVFAEAEKSNLLTAYTQFKNKELLKEIEILKQNEKNKVSSPVKGTTEHGGVVVEKQDDFLKGLGIE